MFRCAFYRNHFGVEVGFYETSQETVNPVRKWPKEEAQAMDDEILG